MVYSIFNISNINFMIFDKNNSVGRSNEILNDSTVEEQKLYYKIVKSV